MRRQRQSALLRARAALITLLLAGSVSAQTAEVYPLQLSRIPDRVLAGGRYFQQLRITFAFDDVASDSTVVIAMPDGVTLADSDGDETYADEIRVKYEPAGDETPRFFVSQLSSRDLIVVGSLDRAAAGGRLYVQFRIVNGIMDQGSASHTINYQQINFEDEREADIPIGPRLSVVSRKAFSTLGSMDIVSLSTPLASDVDTVTSAVGTYYPDDAAILVEALPDLVFDSDDRTTSNLLPFSDGDDGNDTNYRFLLAPVGILDSVDVGFLPEAILDDYTVYAETEGTARPIRLLTRHLAVGTYYLYVAADVTGAIPLARSRGIEIRHAPQVNSVSPVSVPLTLDSGGLYDLEGNRNGNGFSDADITFSAIDHDDDMSIHLFYTALDDLVDDDVTLGATVDLAGAIRVTPDSGVAATDTSFRWDVANPNLVNAGDYYVYAVAVGGEEVGILRSEHLVSVRHSPFMRLDALNDAVISGADTLKTGGLRPQQYVTLTWGRTGSAGDGDPDSDAIISLYYSTKPAVAGALSTDSLFAIPGGAADFLEDSQVHLIASGLREDADSRSDNQYVWDLYQADSVPPAGEPVYFYGIVADSTDSRLAQLNGGRLNDAGSRHIFVHEPTIRALQPLLDIAVPRGSVGRVSWEDEDLDNDAKIRVVLSATNHGDVSTYETVTTDNAFVVNSADGSAQVAVNDTFDLSENDGADFLDVSSSHLTRTVSGSGRSAEGLFYVYLSITDRNSFDGAPAWRTPGRVQLDAIGSGPLASPIRLLPEVFSMGTGGDRQLVEVRVDGGDSEVDVVLVTMRIDGSRFGIVDRDTAVEGIQPFEVGANFAVPNLVMNEARIADESAMIYISLAYVEPSSPIPLLDGDHTLVTFELVSLNGTGRSNTTIDLVRDPESGRVSNELLNNSRTVLTAADRPLSSATLLPGRGQVRGAVNLQRRDDMSGLLNVELRPWGNYEAIADAVFDSTNDVDVEAEGLQVATAADGSFELIQVPPGRYDLHVHFDGFLDGWFPALEVQPGLIIGEVVPTSPSSDSLMLGGDVAGYIELDGSSRPDNEVTLADWDFSAKLFDEFVRASSDSARADFDGDGKVTIMDLMLIADNFKHHGPRPVFKLLPLPTSYAAWTEHRTEDDGETVEVTLYADGLYGVRAFEVALLADGRDWRVDDVRINEVASRGLAVEKERHWGRRLGLCLIGRQADLGAYDQREPLVTWQLLRLRDNAPMPDVSELLLVNHRTNLAVPSRIRRGSADVVPLEFTLGQNYPNPFNPETTIPFTVPGAGNLRLPSVENGETQAVKVEIFNTLGQSQRVLVADELSPGKYSVSWDARDVGGRPVASGVYFYRVELRSGGESQQLLRRMLLVR